MNKELKVTSYNPVLIDSLGNRVPLNAEVYKTEAEIGKAIEKGEIVIPQGFKGIEVIEVKNWVDVKPKDAPKGEPKPKAETKAKATETTNVPNA